MVLSKRLSPNPRSYHFSSPSSEFSQRRRQSCEVSLGFEEPSHPPSQPSEPSWHLSTKASRRLSSSSSSTFNIPQGKLLLFVGVVAVSWLLSWGPSLNMSNATKAIDSQYQLASLHTNQLLENLQDMKRTLNSQRQTVFKLKKANMALSHETSVIDQIDEDWKPPVGGAIGSWMIERQKKLERKMASLQKYVQDESLQYVTKRFGKGPHRVKITVDIPTGDKKSSEHRSFVVETAPLKKMPHAVHFFLDLVENGIWNNTVFLHHEDVDHVIAAAPIDHKSHKIKVEELAHLVWDGMGFPEYSPTFKHAKYTLGFADKGPTFYINTMDNTDLHGPGGQGHHTLPKDADPCFARVVGGLDTVQTLEKLGLENNKFSKDGLHPWAEDEHHWTHIVSAEIL